MSLLVYGINHRTAPLQLREKIAFGESEQPQSIKNLLSSNCSVEECFIVSTCNRTEVYCYIESENSENIRHWLTNEKPVSNEELLNCSYEYWDSDTVSHMSRVACGLDSMALGEPQIMGQVKKSIETANQCNSIGENLDLAVRVAVSAAKEVRTRSKIGENAVSIAYAASSLATKIFSDLSQKKALLIGAGETIEMVTSYLHRKKIGSLTIANRTISNAEALASRYKARTASLSNVNSSLHEFDIVISSTASSFHIIGKGTAEAAIKKRLRKPIFMVDLAVPRDIEPEISELPDIYLYSIDDLQEITTQNIQLREEEKVFAESIIEEAVKEYEAEVRLNDDLSFISAFRDKAEQVRLQELNRAIRQINNGKDPTEILGELSKSLTNKLIHSPTSAIRQASRAGRREIISNLKEIYEISDLNTAKKNEVSKKTAKE
jgi:glutamyl-tRNA reductase